MRHTRRSHPQPQQDEEEELERVVEEAEAVFVCHPPAHQPLPELLAHGQEGWGEVEGDVVSFTLAHEVGLEAVMETPSATLAGVDEYGGEYNQYQTVEIQGLSYNSILGQ
jgi:hypothetical protein